MIIKACTVKDLAQHEGKIEHGLYLAVKKILSVLDSTYGTERNESDSDGGFVVIAETVQDLTEIERQYVALNSGRHEAVDVLKCEKAVYINALFLQNNEFGINVFMPISISPPALLSDIPHK